MRAVSGERVAVVIPCYKGGDTLRETLGSIDEPEPIEVVVVDDGSPDDETQRVLAELETEGVRVVHQENAGLAPARMTGLHVTTARYVCALDDDDLLTPGSLSKLADALDANPAAAVAWGDQQDFGEDTTFIRHAHLLDPWLITYLNGIPVNALVRREALLDAGGWQTIGSGYEDWNLWMAFAEHGFQGIHLPILACFYRVSSTRMFADAVAQHGTLRDALRERHRALFAARRANWRRSRAPWRCKLLLPLIEHLPLGAFTQHRLSRVVNDPIAPIKARLRLRPPALP
jgi:glycosyltransferase involved in cell wall biosynthesis